jgi:hypothetical protein
MRRPRFQFRLSTLLWITAVVAGFFAGVTVQRQVGERAIRRAANESAKREIDAMTAVRQAILDVKAAEAHQAEAEADKLRAWELLMEERKARAIAEAALSRAEFDNEVAPKP